MDNSDAIFSALPKTLKQKAEKFLLQIRKNEKKFKKTFNPQQNVPMEPWRAVFKTPPENL